MLLVTTRVVTASSVIAMPAHRTRRSSIVVTTSCFPAGCPRRQEARTDAPILATVRLTSHGVPVTRVQGT